jgi:hypothetical protein
VSLGLRACHSQQLIDKAALAPIEIEGLIKDHIMFVLFHKDCMKRCAKVETIANTSNFDCMNGVNDTTGPNRQTSAAQQASEVKNVEGQTTRAVVLIKQDPPRHF